MNKFFERSILDELYEAKSDEFAQDIQNEMQEETKSFLVEEQLTNKIKEVIKDEGQQKEMLKKLNEYEMEVAKEHDFWNKMFYKLGVYNCAEMKEILLNKIYSKENAKSFFDEYTDNFMEYFEEHKMKTLKDREDYEKISNKILELENKYPNTQLYLEDDEIVNLNEKERKVVLEIIDLQDDITILEIKESFKLGIKEAYIYFKEMGMLNI